jgi:cytohesin
VEVRTVTPPQANTSPFSLFDYLRINNELLIVAEQGRIAEVTRLLDIGANVNAHDQYGVTALHLAVCNNREDVATTLINRGAMVNALENNGCVPLHCAAARGFLDIAKLLIANGGNANARDKDKETPLHSAARSTPTRDIARDMVTLLLANGAEINPRSKNGSTPLHEAMEFGYPETVAYLRQKGATL